MDFSENGTNVYLKFVDENKSAIDVYTPRVEQILMECQVSGAIQNYDLVEFGLYTEENHSLCSYGPFVSARVPVSKFIMTGGFVYIGMQAKGRDSMFAHMVHWLEGNTSKEIYLDFSNLFSVLESSEKNSVQLKMMISGIKEDGSSDVMMRDLDVLVIGK